MAWRWFHWPRSDHHVAARAAYSQQSRLYLEGIEEGVIALGGGEYRGVLEVAARNLDLASPEEKDAVVAAFQAFLNGLTFPIQVLVRIERLGAEEYLTLLAVRARDETSPRLRELALAQLAFVRDLAASQVLLRRRFFLVLPFTVPPPREALLAGLFGGAGRTALTASPDAAFARRQVARRQAEVIRRLDAVGLRTRALGTDEVLGLYYALLCPTLARLQPLHPAVAGAIAPVIQRSPAVPVARGQEVRCLAR